MNDTANGHAADTTPETQAPPKLTMEEHTRAKFLFTNRELCVLRMQVSPEGQAVMRANAALADFEQELCERYGVTAPVEIADDGTIKSA